jgi:hypothetical protein
VRHRPAVDDRDPAVAQRLLGERVEVGEDPLLDGDGALEAVDALDLAGREPQQQDQHENADRRPRPVAQRSGERAAAQHAPQRGGNQQVAGDDRQPRGREDREGQQGEGQRDEGRRSRARQASTPPATMPTSTGSRRISPRRRGP